MKKLLIAALVLSGVMTSLATAHAADSDTPFVAPLFTDNMVLQRGMADPVWGWTSPGAKVVVTIAGKTATATADSTGKWLTRVGPLPVGGPYELTVSGSEKVTFKNILVGDVWICSGQSNMEMGIGNVRDAEKEIANANYPQIRLFTVTKKVALAPQTSIVRRDNDLMGQWSVCTPETVKTGGWNGFSAAGFFFGRTLNGELKVPIGLIHTSWGGTIAEAWTSSSALQKLPDFRDAARQVDAMAGTDLDKGYAVKLAEWYGKNDVGSTGATPAWASVTLDTADWKTMALPTAWESAGLPDFDGVVWFRKTFDLPAGAAGKEVILHLGPIDDQDTTWVNGQRVGATGDYLTDRAYRIPGSLLKTGKNTIAVRVLDTGVTGGIYGKPEQLSVEIPGSSSIPLAGPWQYRASTPLAKASLLPKQVGSNNPNVATVLYNGMIAPVIPFGIKGAIWYQGESNAGRAYQYRSLLPTMIGDWRARWGEGDFPFYIVQLANFTATLPQPADNEWAELREAQLMTSENVKNSGLAVAIDIGEAGDIHPKNKQEVGRRLALAALGTTYGKKIEYSGPVYRSMKKEEGRIRLSFDHLGGGLVAKGEKLTGFAIAGEDHKWAWADAVIDGNTVVVSSPQIINPVAVRYAWAANPVCNLCNKAGLPASPFRTDDWPGITVKNK